MTTHDPISEKYRAQATVCEALVKEATDAALKREWHLVAIEWYTGNRVAKPFDDAN